MTHVPDLSAEVAGLFVGKVRVRWEGKAPSAIAKQASMEPLTLTPTGFEADEQADLKVHGGLEKAVHHYAADHYADWENECGPSQGILQPGGFGENLSTYGLTEKNLCIGDVFQLGTATVQVSQGRQPCWKLNAHTGIEQIAYQFQKTARTGWYYRVLETGVVAVGDQIKLIDRPNPDASVEEVTRARLSSRTSPEIAARFASLPELNQGWRDALQKKSTRGYVEDTSARLGKR